MDELITIGEKHAEAGMGVIPADDAFALVSGVHLVVDVLPRVMREFQGGLFRLGVQSGKR